MSLALATTLVTGGLIVPHHVSAQITIDDSIGHELGLGNSDLKSVTVNVLRWVLGIISLAAVTMIIYGGVVWLTSAGNEDRIDKAKQIISAAIIGLIVVILAWVIVLFVARAARKVTNTSGATF